MYRLILVPLDGSSQAESILDHAAQLSENQMARVVLLRVDEPDFMLEYDEVVDIESTRADREVRRRDIEQYLKARQTDLQARGIETEIRMVQGPVVKTIVHVAQQIGADLVAMASHGMGGSRRISYGSVAAGVLQHLDRPMLLIRCNPSTD